MNLFKVKENIHCLNFKSYLCCNYIIEKDGELFLIDGDMCSRAKNIEMALQQMGKSFSDIKAILLTHWHNDHSAGVAEIQKMSGCKIYCHKEELPFFDSKPSGLFKFIWNFLPDFFLFVLFKGLVFNRVPFSLNNVTLVKDGDTIEGIFTAIETPGHTKGHMSYLMPSKNTLFTGDALAVVQGKIDLMAKVVTPDLSAANGSAKKLCKIPFSTICPGHRMPLHLPKSTVHDLQDIEPQCLSKNLVTLLAEN